MAEKIIKAMQGEANKKYFADPNLERDMTVAGAAFDMVSAGHASFVGGERMKKFMKANNFKNKDELFNGMRSWARARQTKKLIQGIGSGALDLLGNLAGPMGVGFSLVGAVFSFWETDDLPKILENLATKIIQACQEMIDAAIFKERLRAANDYLAAFSTEGKYAMDAFKALSEKPPPNAGTLQFVLLQSLETALATSRYEWMPFLNKQACSYNHKSCHGGCANIRTGLTKTVPLLAAMHLSLIQQMGRSVATNPPLVKIIKDKFWRHVHEYQQYAARWIVHQHNGWTPYWPENVNPIYICGKGDWRNVKKEHDEIGKFSQALYQMILADWSNQWQRYSARRKTLYSWTEISSVSDEHLARQRRLAARLPPLLGDVHLEFHRICGDGLECLMEGDASQEQAAAFSALARKMMELVKNSTSLDASAPEMESAGELYSQELLEMNEEPADPKCCTENKAECLGCQVDLTADQFCKKYGLAADCPSTPDNCMCPEFYEPVCAQYEGKGRVFMNECTARCYVGSNTTMRIVPDDHSVDHTC